MRPLPAFLLLSLMLPSIAPATEDWHRFRGPNGSGVGSVSGLPSTLGEDSIDWRIDVPPGWSSPVLWQGRLILTAETHPSKRAVICLDASSGQELWRHEVSFTEHRQHKFNSFASSTPYIDPERIYVTWTSGNDVQALALDHQGKVLWQREGIANYVHEHGSGVSPAVADGVLMVRAEFATEKKGRPLAEPDQLGWKSSIIGLDISTGEDVWRTELPNSFNPYSTPTIRETADGAKEFVIANTSSGFMGIDARSGRINWQHNPGYSQRSVASLTVDDDIVFSALGSGGGGKESALIQIRDGKAEEIGEIDVPLPYVPSPVLLDNRLYILNDGGIFSCVEWPSGKEVYEPQRLVGMEGRSTKYFSSPVAADGKIYCGSQTGEVVTLKAGEQFEVLGVSKLDSPINATPAIGAGALFVRTQNSLYRIPGAATSSLP